MLLKQGRLNNAESGQDDQAILRKKNYFEQILGSGPPWGSKTLLAPLTQILDPRLGFKAVHLGFESWVPAPPQIKTRDFEVKASVLKLCLGVSEQSYEFGRLDADGG